MGADTRIVKTIRFHPTELEAINAARGDETFTSWILEAIHQRLGTPRTVVTPQRTDVTYTDDVIPPGAGCPVCGSTSVGLHRSACLYAQ